MAFHDGRESLDSRSPPFVNQHIAGFSTNVWLSPRLHDFFARSNGEFNKNHILLFEFVENAVGFLSHRLAQNKPMKSPWKSTSNLHGHHHGFFPVAIRWNKTGAPRHARGTGEGGAFGSVGIIPIQRWWGDFTYQKWEKLEFFADWLAVWNMNGWFFPIGNVIIPIDLNSIIFQRGGSTTSQLIFMGIWWNFRRIWDSKRDFVIDSS